MFNNVCGIKSHRTTTAKQTTSEHTHAHMQDLIVKREQIKMQWLNDFAIAMHGR